MSKSARARPPAARGTGGDDALRGEVQIAGCGFDRRKRAQVHEVAQLRFGEPRAFRKLDERQRAAFLEPGGFSEFHFHS